MTQQPGELDKPTHMADSLWFSNLTQTSTTHTHTHIRTRTHTVQTNTYCSAYLSIHAHKKQFDKGGAGRRWGQRNFNAANDVGTTTEQQQQQPEQLELELELQSELVVPMDSH